MNMNVFKGKWKQFRGSVQEKWGELTNDDLDQINGEFDQLVGMIQERYGKSMEEAREEAEKWWRQQDVETERTR